MNFSDPVNVDEKWAGVFAKLAPIDPVLRSKALLFLAKVLVISVTCCSEQESLQLAVFKWSTPLSA